MKRIFIVLVLLSGCNAPQVSTEVRVESYTPGLHTQMYELAHRHSKLWFAGHAENWELADYEFHELEELAELIASTHETYDNMPIGSLMQAMFLNNLSPLEGAIDAQSKSGFEAQFHRMTQSCNTCHVASNRSFIVIQTPTQPPITNLRFDPQN